MYEAHRKKVVMSAHARIYLKEEPAVMAPVRAAKDGREAPGKIYSLIKSELCR